MGMAYKSATGDPPSLIQNECDKFDPQSILVKDHFMGTPTIVRNTYILFTLL